MDQNRNQGQRKIEQRNRTNVRNNTPNGQRRSSKGRRPIKSKWQKKRKRSKRLQRLRELQPYAVVLIPAGILIIVILYLAVVGLCSIIRGQSDPGSSVKAEEVKLDAEIEKLDISRPDIDVNLLTKNKYSRPGTELKKVNGIVIHYVGNAGTTAAQNRSYFESLKDTHNASASSHFVVGIDGEIVQCVPTTEIAYCSNDRNDDTISIECCHPKKDGKFTEETYDSLVELTAFLCCKYDLEMEDIIRHYDVTGKQCPKYFVTHTDEWTQFKKDVAAYIKKNAKKVK